MLEKQRQTEGFGLGPRGLHQLWAPQQPPHSEAGSDRNESQAQLFSLGKLPGSLYKPPPPVCWEGGGLPWGPEVQNSCLPLCESKVAHCIRTVGTKEKGNV